MKKNICNSHSRMLALSLSEHNSGVHNFNQKYNKQRIQIFQSCRIFQNQKTKAIKFFTLEHAKKGRIPLADYQLIVSINITKSLMNQKKFVINRPCDFNKAFNNQVFLSLRNYSAYYEERGFKLSPGDIIKLGRKKIKVIHININEQMIQQVQNLRSEQNFKSLKSFHLYDSVPEGHCRICLHDQIQQGDYLLNPCQCRGTCANVHFSCLKKWVENKVHYERNGKLQIYNFKNFKCQICKSELPKCIYQKNKSFNAQISLNCLFKMNLPIYLPYIILQPQNDNRWLVLILNESTSFQLGCSSSSSIILRQHNVSKIHAQLNFHQNDGFYLKDLYSEFGTYVLLRKPLEISYCADMQIGNLLFELKIEKESQNVCQMVDC